MDSSSPRPSPRGSLRSSRVGPLVSPRLTLTARSSPSWPSPRPTAAATTRSYFGGGEYPNLETLLQRQRSIASRRGEILGEQLQVTREINEAAAAQLNHTVSSSLSTSRALSRSRTMGTHQYASPSPRVKELEDGNACGLGAQKLLGLQRALEKCDEEERGIVSAIALLHPGAVAGVGPRAAGVSSFASWQSTYG